MSQHTHVRPSRLVVALTTVVVLVAATAVVTASASAAPPGAVAGVAHGSLASRGIQVPVPALVAIAEPVLRPSGPNSRSGARTAGTVSYRHFTLRSRATRDMRGVEGSLYQGRYFKDRVEPLRRCIAQRESMGQYGVVSASGSYFGAYQVSRELARGATWMMLREHKRLLGAKAAKQILSRLRATPMNQWPRYWQDAAFSTVMNWQYPRSGAAHWAGGRWTCTSAGRA